MDYKKNNQKLPIALLILSVLLMTSCTISSTPKKEKSVKKETLYIHNKTFQRKTKWSFSINGKQCYPLPRNKEMLLSIDFMDEYAQLKNKASIYITPLDSNCRVTKINNQEFKVLINHDFSPNLLRLTVEASPNKNVTVINTQYQVTYNFQDKFFLAQLNNIVAEK